MKSLLLIFFLAAVHCNAEDALRMYNKYCNDPSYENITPSMEYWGDYKFVFKNKNFPHGVILNHDDIMSLSKQQTSKCLEYLCDDIPNSDLNKLVYQFNQLLWELKSRVRMSGANLPLSQRIVKMDSFTPREIEETASNLPKVCMFFFPDLGLHKKVFFNYLDQLPRQTNSAMDDSVEASSEPIRILSETQDVKKYKSGYMPYDKDYKAPTVKMLFSMEKDQTVPRHQSPRMTSGMMERRSDDLRSNDYAYKASTNGQLFPVKKSDAVSMQQLNSYPTEDTVEGRDVFFDDKGIYESSTGTLIFLKVDVHSGSKQKSTRSMTQDLVESRNVVPVDKLVYSTQKVNVLPMYQSKILMTENVMKGRNDKSGDNEYIYKAKPEKMHYSAKKVQALPMYQSTRLMTDSIMEGRDEELAGNEYIEAQAKTMLYATNTVQALPMYQSKRLMTEGVVEGRNINPSHMGYIYTTPTEKFALPSRRRRSVLDNDVSYYTEVKVPKNNYVTEVRLPAETGLSYIVTKVVENL